MGGNSPSSPAPINPYDSANAQGAQNFMTAMMQMYGNRIQQDTPYGNLQYETKGFWEIDPKTGQMQLVDKAKKPPKLMTQKEWGKDNKGYKSYDDYRNATYANTTRYLPNQVQTVKLSPAQQKLLDERQSQDLQMTGAQRDALKRVDKTMDTPFSMKGAPKLDAFAEADPLQKTLKLKDGSFQTRLNQRDLSFQGNPMLPGNDDFGAERLRVEDALYGRMDRKFGEDEEALRTRLANAGVQEGSEAWNRQMRGFNEAKTDARQQVIANAGQEQSRLFGQALTARQQANTEDSSLTDSYNQNNLNEGNFRNQVEGQRVNIYNQNNLNEGNFRNQASNMDFNQQLQEAQLNNQARSQFMSEGLTQRQLPMNEFNALRSGTQIQSPTFQNVPLFSMQAPDLQGAMETNYAQQQAQANAKAAAGAAQMQGIMQTGSTMALLASDIRVKENIKRIGVTDGGHSLYKFNYIGNPKLEIGVMAQEVEKTQPHLVKVINGVKHVNYEGIE